MTFLLLLVLVGLGLFVNGLGVLLVSAVVIIGYIYCFGPWRTGRSYDDLDYLVFGALGFVIMWGLYLFRSGWLEYIVHPFLR